MVCHKYLMDLKIILMAFMKFPRDLNGGSVGCLLTSGMWTTRVLNRLTLKQSLLTH